MGAPTEAFGKADIPFTLSATQHRATKTVRFEADFSDPMQIVP